MNDKPTTGEWTMETIAHLQAHGGIDAIVAAHNAQIAVAYETYQSARRSSDMGWQRAEDYKQQLAAERDQPKPASGEWTAKSVFTLYGHPNNPDGWQVVADAHNAALAAEREKPEGMKSGGVQKMDEQLAAEREVGHNQAVTLGQQILRLEDQLAAAVEALYDISSYGIATANSHITKLADATLVKIGGAK